MFLKLLALFKAVYLGDSIFLLVLFDSIVLCFSTKSGTLKKTLVLGLGKTFVVALGLGRFVLFFFVFRRSSSYCCLKSKSYCCLPSKRVTLLMLKLLCYS